MKIVVTGGCGYIGSHVARAFKQQGHNVFIIDRVDRAHARKDMDGYLIKDFASDVALSMLHTLAPDVIVHCAGTSLVGPSMTNPSEYYDNNIAKTIKLLNVVKDLAKKPYIMFSSSASVYGQPDTWPIKEDSAIQPISPYGNTKAMTEVILRDYAAAYGIDSICFRYFNAAGAEPENFDLGQEPGATHIVARVLEASINDTEFTLNGSDFDTHDGSCIRDYVHVWDLAQAHIKGFEFLHKTSDSEQTGSSYVFNLGTNSGISNWEIVRYVSEHYGLDRLLVQSRRPGDPDVLIADASLANDVLGWYPEHSDIATIIDSACKWYTRDV
jgi:UDP-glucose 4-epimerase